MVESITLKSIIAINIYIEEEENVVNKFRKLCGPYDSQIAQVLEKKYGKTIRAEFGIDKINNAVHCTDLENDGQLENEFFFKIIQ
jgi:nucleoside-diphosphate kinase